MKIARVFPRKTTASPTDDMSFFGAPGLFPIEADEVHISVTWSYDIERAEMLADQWRHVAPVKIGGPALGDPGGDFVPGRYLKKGYVITSRGCPNNCWFCDVPKREGDIRELPVTEGNNLLDSNILACSEGHIKEVFAMLKRQDRKAQLTGGLEAARLDDWRVNMLWDLRPEQMFFAYDTPDDLDPLMVAGGKLRRADFTRSHCRCYVLIGWPTDTMEAAKERLLQTWDAGFLPMAMLWKDKNGYEMPEWAAFQRTWARPAIIRSMVKKELCTI